jgi:Cu2+-exporting ATPase
MQARMQLLPHAKGRVRIAGASAGSADAEALLGWLLGRTEVLLAHQSPGTGVLYVDYEDGKGLSGRFLRALTDKLYALEHPPAESFDVQPLHSLPGRIRLKVRGLLAGELAKLMAFAAALPGILDAQASPDSETLLLKYNPNELSEARILDALRKSDPAEWPVESPPQKRLPWGNAVASSAVLGLCVTRAFPFPILAGGIVLNMLRPLRRTLIALSQGQISIDLLDVVASWAALLTGQAATASFILWMVSIGDLLLDISADKARTALSKLMQMEEPDAFRLRSDGSTERVPVAELELGDRLVVDGGHGIPADGEVVSGVAVVDEKVLTGESKLVAKQQGAYVYAATIVVEGQLVVEVKRSGRNTEAWKIVKILESARQKPLTLQRQALEVAGRLVPPTFGIAGLAGVLAADINRTVCLLITDFGTGIRIAVPTSALTAMTLAAREGVLIKGAQYLERLSKADVIIFDKTGTLTLGEPEVVDVVPGHDFTESKIISLCASAEARHEHPVAKALKSYAEKQRFPLLKTELGSEEYTVGQGLSTRIDGRHVLVGNAGFMYSNKIEIGHFWQHLERFKEEQISALCVAVDGQMAGLVGYSDAIRKESAATAQKLKANGRRKLVLLSGDSQSAVEAVARTVRIDEAIGALLPDEKAEYVKKLRAQGHVVAMIGDGINDAPALALADVGISIAGSSEVAVETADVVLLEGGLLQLAEAFAISDRAMACVRRNLGVIIVPNAIAILLGALGFISPPVAAIINNGATLLSLLVGAAPLATTPVQRLFDSQEKQQLQAQSKQAGAQRHAHGQREHPRS